MVDLSIIIVNYKLRDKAVECLRSIYESDFGEYSYEVLLIDNSSGDGIEGVVKEKFPKVVFIQAGENLGMGRGNNIGINESVGRYVLILNPDTVVKENAIKVMCDKFKEKGIGMIGPKLLYPNGEHQNSCFRFPHIMTPIYRRTPLGRLMPNKVQSFTMNDVNFNNEVEVDWLMGSCLLTSRDILKKVGLFDDRFFMYFEDTDLCRRIKCAKYKVLYHPNAVVYHHHGRGSAKTLWYLAPFTNKLARIHIESWAKYFWKWKFKN